MTDIKFRVWNPDTLGHILISQPAGDLIDFHEWLKQNDVQHGPLAARITYASLGFLVGKHILEGTTTPTAPDESDEA